jgi:hypothetical protein
MAVQLTSNRSIGAGTTCARAECQQAAVAVLEEKSLCLDHFFSRCYTALEDFDQYRDYSRVGREQNRARVRAFLDECSAQALNVSLRVTNMSNLQRARLLDVLLWAGELSEFAYQSKNQCVPAANCEPHGNLAH